MGKKLSKENYDKLNENYLYRKEPPDRSWKTLWCKNWTFRIFKKDGKAFMEDTFWSNGGHTIEVTDDNINEFEKVFDFREVEKIHCDEADDYNDEDVYKVAIGSGGWEYGVQCFIKKGAKKNRQKLIEKKKYEIEQLKKQLEWAEEELKELMKEEEEQ